MSLRGAGGYCLLGMMYVSPWSWWILSIRHDVCHSVKLVDIVY